MAPSSNSRESSLSTPPEQNPVEPTSAGIDSGSELSELTDEEIDARKLPRVRTNYRFVGRRPPSLLARRGGRRKRSNLVPAPMWGWVDKASAAEEEEEEELSEPPAAMEEEEMLEEEEEEPNSVIVNDSERGNTNLERPPVAGIALDVGSDDEGPVNGDDDDEDGQAVAPSDEEIQPAEDETDVDDESDKNEEDDDDEAEDEELNIASPGILTTTTVPMADAETLLSLAPAAGPPAITADDVEPPSPSSTSASNSAVSSRAPSPLPIESESVAPDLVSATRPRRPDVKGKLSLSRIEPPAEDDADTPASSKEKSVGMDIDPTDALQDAQDDIEGEDGEAAIEEDMEAELDLQPAIRGEALDVLAILELKFALLRERLYVDKMQALAWEETLVDYGTHPELLHLHRELSKRRDKRLELATRKRAFEITNVNKRRRLDENATWSWWKQARDDLQKEMIAESNRKRRKLEREKRAMERPQPVRRIPTSPLEIPIPLSVRALVDSYVAGNPPRHDSQTLVYPQLSSLSSADIANDLDFIHVQKQSNMFDQHRNTVPLPSTAQQPPSILNYDPTFPDAFQPTAATRANQLPLVGYHHAQPAPAPPQGMVGPGQAGPPFVPYNPGHGRPSHLAGNSMHGPSSFVDPEPAWSVSSGPVNPNVGFSPHTMPPRRSISPSLPPGLKTSGQWTGMGGFHSSKPDPEEEERREREKRERGHYEMERQREYHLQNLQQQQHHRHGASIHHSHNSTPTPHPSHHHHGRPHHHHVLHHHAPAAPTGATLSPRTTREMEGGRHGTEIINLSSNKNHWKDEYREKRPNSAAPIIEDRDRPLAMPFTMSASHRSPPHRPEISSPGRTSWSQDEMYRSPMNSPGRYNRIGSLSERPRTLPPPSPSAVNPARSPTRYRERSPPPKAHRPLSPIGKGALLPPLSTPVSRVPSPLLARGPGDRDQPRELLSPRPPSKMTVTQILD